MNRGHFALALTLVATLTTAWALADGRDNGLRLKTDQKEFLALEPILVSVLVPDGVTSGLPVEAGAKDGLTFDIKPAVKPRTGAKPLPQEAKTKGQSVKSRVYDLLEWYQFPAEGKFTVQAVLQTGGATQTSAPITISLLRPAKENSEWGPVDRLHHMPWSNYVTDAFCGDTFDVVKRWPDSKLTKHCHYWNGLHHQHKKEYDKAVASFRIVVERYPDFVLRPHAQRGIEECTLELGRGN